jgi:hypothetical protein
VSKIKLKTVLRNILNFQNESNDKYLENGFEDKRDSEDYRVNRLSILSTRQEHNDLLIGLETESFSNNNLQFNKRLFLTYQGIASGNDDIIIDFLAGDFLGSFKVSEIAKFTGFEISYIEERLKILTTYRIISKIPLLGFKLEKLSEKEFLSLFAKHYFSPKHNPMANLILSTLKIEAHIRGLKIHPSDLKSHLKQTPKEITIEVREEPKYSINKAYLFDYIPHLLTLKDFKIVTNKLNIEIKEGILKIQSLDNKFLFENEYMMKSLFKPQFYVLAIKKDSLIIYLHHQLNKRRIILGLDKIKSITGDIIIEILDHSELFKFRKTNFNDYLDDFIIDDEDYEDDIYEEERQNEIPMEVSCVLEKTKLSQLIKNGQIAVTRKIYHIEDKFADFNATKSNIQELINEIKNSNLS